MHPGAQGELDRVVHHKALGRIAQSEGKIINGQKVRLIFGADLEDRLVAVDQVGNGAGNAATEPEEGARPFVVAANLAENGEDGVDKRQDRANQQP